MSGPLSGSQFINIIPSYVYVQYNDDDNIQAMFSSYNSYAQQYLNTFNLLGLSVYTSTIFVGPLLDWIGQGIYGFPRPFISNVKNSDVGDFNTYTLNSVQFNGTIVQSSSTSYTVTDDIYKRCLTWRHYKNDGPQFTIPWLKRRVLRFFGGTNGTDVSVANTTAVSVQISNYVITITIYLDEIASAAVFNIFSAAIEAGVLPLPFQYSVNVLATASLSSDGGALLVASVAGYPTSPAGLAAGALWSNSGLVTVVPGVTPDPTAPAVYFNNITAAQLLALGGGNLPTTAPTAGSGQLWSNSGEVAIA